MVGPFIFPYFSHAHFISRHVYMVVSEISTLFFYIFSMAFLPEYFGEEFLRLL